MIDPHQDPIDEDLPTPVSLDNVNPVADPSAYEHHDLAAPGVRVFESASALGSSPGELAGALAGMPGPFTPAQIQVALEAYRNREIPTG